MKPMRLVPTSLLKLVLPASLLLCIPSVGHAQLVSTATYTADTAGWTSYNQKVIAVGADGYTRFLVEEDNGPPDYQPQLTYVRCLDLACDAYNTQSWVINRLSAFAYSLAIGPDGYARIAYQQTGFFVDDAGEYHFGTLAFILCADANCASSTNNSFIDYAAGSYIASVAVGSDGTTYIAYDNGNTDDGPQGIGLATCTGTSCSTTTIATGIDVMDLTAATIAIGSDGNPVIAYTDLHLSSSNSYISSSGHYYENGTDVVLTNDADTTDLAIGPDGFARVLFGNTAWWSGETRGFNFAECTNTSCSSAAVNPISVQGTVGSVAVAADGNAYLELDLTGGSSFSGDSTYYVECTAADCSDYESSLISANSGDSSGVASMVADANGLPRMIVQDLSGVVYVTRLKVSAVISQNTSGPISSDDSARGNFQSATGSSTLGPFIENTTLLQGCAVGFETVGTITPSRYTGNVIIQRTIVNQGLYVDSTDHGGEAPPTSMTPQTLHIRIETRSQVAPLVKSMTSMRPRPIRTSWMALRTVTERISSLMPLFRTAHGSLLITTSMLAYPAQRRRPGISSLTT